MLKKRLTSLKTIEKPCFFIRRMQKVGQKHWGSEFGWLPLVGGAEEGNPYCAPKMRLGVL